MLLPPDSKSSEYGARGDLGIVTTDLVLRSELNRKQSVQDVHVAIIVRMLRCTWLSIKAKHERYPKRTMEGNEHQRECSMIISIADTSG